MSKKISMIHQAQKNQIATKSSFDNVMIFLVGYRFQRSPNFRKKADSIALFRKKRFFWVFH
jgi:hypothetical protein